MQSSANNFILHSMLLVMSLINIKNKTGPSTDPCGTPDVTGTFLDGMFSITTNWDLSNKKSLIQVVIAPFPSTVSSFAISFMWQTESNALARSSNIISI